jgi:tetratricopeptide (TPR) repeat protein
MQNDINRSEVLSNAEHLLREGNIQEAQEQYRILKDLDKTDILTNYNYARCFLLKTTVTKEDVLLCKHELQKLISNVPNLGASSVTKTVLETLLVCCEYVGEKSEILALLLKLTLIDKSPGLFYKLGNLLLLIECNQEANYFFSQAKYLVTDESNEAKDSHEQFDLTKNKKSIYVNAPRILLLNLAEHFSVIGEIKRAIKIYKELGEIDANDIKARYLEAKMYLHDESIGLHEGISKCRDLLLTLVEEIPSLEQNPAANLEIFARLAENCKDTGQVERAIKYVKLVLSAYPNAQYYYYLYSLLIEEDKLVEAYKALQDAINLDPKYDTEQNREIISLSLKKIEGFNVRKIKAKKSRYPSTEIFTGDFSALVKNYIAADLMGDDHKFISSETKFFTMGSCFAANISRALTNSGFFCEHLGITEHINTTYANRFFAEWLKQDSVISVSNLGLNKKFQDLTQGNFTPESTVKAIAQADCFILTLGVAPAFFDRDTGEFVMPKSTQITANSLSDKFYFRTTSVSENVENIKILIDKIRDISPSIKIILTVSPVPLMASFEYDSCVVADCISKSIMRVTAHEIIANSGIKNIHYWPSFEIFRWVGSHSGGFYGGDDGYSIHVTEAKVDATINAFIDVFRLKI